MSAMPSSFHNTLVAPNKMKKLPMGRENPRAIPVITTISNREKQKKQKTEKKPTSDNNTTSKGNNH